VLDAPPLLENATSIRAEEWAAGTNDCPFLAHRHGACSAHGMASRARASKVGFRGKLAWFGWLPLLGALVACGTSSGTGLTDTSGAGAGGIAGGAGPTVNVAEPKQLQRERERVRALLGSVEGLDAEQLVERYAATFEAAPSYEQSALLGLPLLQGSSLALDETELEALGSKGFVVSDRASFPSFAYGYQNIYMDDLPVYVSADSVLDAIHRSYDDILQDLERVVLLPELASLLDGMRARLAAGAGDALGAAALKDADVYLAVAASLSKGSTHSVVAGGDQSLVDELVAKATAHEGLQRVTLFGVQRDEDFSQYEPRGHYAAESELEQYFRAMMWLGRVDFRLLETQPDGAQLFRRRQLEGVLLMNELLDAELRAHFERIDSVLAAFVGEPDYMVPRQVPALLEALGVSSAAGVAEVSDEAIVGTLQAGGFGTQRISSHVMINGTRAGTTLPLSLSFALMGQRYVIDSHVFSNVVYDRVPTEPYRMMPNPLDVGFAVLGNDQAAQLLLPELERYGYAPALASMRVLADDHPSEFWSENLYNSWLASIRGLSPLDERAPSVAKSEAWGRRMLQAQLASWAQLRHDTVLYAKQSYTGGVECEFPDAYVDPYPQVFAGLQAYGEIGARLIQGLELAGPFGERVLQHFQKVSEVGNLLREMAEHELSGTSLTPEMLAFVNQAVVLDQGCGDPSIRSGWYHQLFYNTETAPDYDPTIADVHTQPTDEGGAPVGKVLHVATGMPRLMVVAVDTCSGPRVYAGLASSYFERTTEQFERATDEAWAESIRAGNPDDVSWLTDVVTRSSGPRLPFPEAE
jgi:hypothetical protein